MVVTDLQTKVEKYESQSVPVRRAGAGGNRQGPADLL